MHFLPFPYSSCPLDGEIMGEFEYSEGQDEAKVSFPAHKFPYTASVYYECIVKLCHINDSECKRVSAEAPIHIEGVNNTI